MKNSNRNTKVRTLTVMTAIMFVIISSMNLFAQQQIRNYNFTCNNISSNDNARAIINRIDSGYAIAGYSYHPTCAISPFDWMWIQLKKDGTVNQSRYYGTQGDDKCFSLIQDPSDRTYTLAGYMYDGAYGRPRATLVDVNSIGNFNYSRRIHDTLSSSYSQVVIDPARVLGFTGYLEKMVGNKTRNKLLATQYTPAGVLNWGYRYDSWVTATQQSPSTEEGKSICFQPVGGVYGIAARTNFYSKSTTAWDPMIVKLSYTGAVIWKKVYRFNVTNPNYYPSAEPTKIIPMQDGGFVVVGFTNSILQNGSHILVFRVSSNGNLMWSASYGNTTTYNYGHSIVLDGNNLVVTGYRRTVNNTVDALMMKIPVAGGIPLWTRIWDPQQNTEIGYDIVLSNQSTASFGYAVTGDVSLNSNDAFLWRTNANGLLDSSTCNNSLTLERIANDVRLDSFTLVRVAKYDKEFTPAMLTTNYRHNTICLGTFATLPEEINNDNPAEEVNDFAVSQNYPNPFNPSTSIRFQVPADGNVSIKVYDVSGKMVAELVNGFIQKGSHSVQFNASNLSSGAYYYRMDANGFTDIKKMLLIK
jgi:hypothetical protein